MAKIVPSIVLTVSRSSVKGLAPMVTPETLTPRSMEVTKTCESEKMIMTADSHFLAIPNKINPIKACHKAHTRKLPSCPAQKHETMYFMGNSTDEYCHT